MSDKDKLRSKLWYENNKEKVAAKAKEKYLANREERILKMKERYKNNKEDYAAKARIYRLANKEYLKAKKDEWCDQNRGHRIIKAMIRKNKINKHQTPSWSDKDSINIVYMQAKRISQIEGIQYHVDHIIPLNGKLVSGLHVINNLQIITAKDNISKHNKFTL